MQRSRWRLPPTIMVTGPLGQSVVAAWAMVNGTAVIEMAQSSGLQHVIPSVHSARYSHTEGTGELIRAALDVDATRIVVGVGGSATTDGGIGALRALGVQFRDERGAAVSGGGSLLRQVAAADLSRLDGQLDNVELILCSDVSNPSLALKAPL